MRQLTATGFWPLYRFDPRRADEGKLPLALDSRPPSDALAETLMQEQRFRRLNAQQPEVAEQLWKDAAADLQKRYDFWRSWRVKRKIDQRLVSLPGASGHFFAIKKPGVFTPGESR